MEKEIENLYGHLLTENQIPQEAKHLTQVIQANGKTCLRCGTSFQEENKLPDGSLYCRDCILMGRVTNKSNLYYLEAPPFPPQTSLNWAGQLTEFQSTISKGLSENIAHKIPTLIHAVTGAGKTEMVYQAIAQVIDSGGAVCLASPRIDVCIELHQRISRDFSCKTVLLHGESEPYERSPLVIVTTHQLLKFYHVFDLILIDEVDAFPYVDNPILYHAVEQALKPSGVHAFLTATSTAELDKKVKTGKLQKLTLPKRFHGNPLIIPQKVWMTGFGQLLKKGKLPNILERKIKAQRNDGFPLLLFAPQIQTGQELAKVLQKYFPAEKIGFVSSQTENRQAIVQAFRNQELTMLVSTTILERGVTFPKVDVFVVEANHHLYTSSSLIQIGGRVGRSMDRPTGQLLFFSQGTTKAIEKAIKEIKSMNTEAGYD